jgi:hypothetical protein
LDAAAKATSDESLPEPSEPIYAPLEEALPIYRGSGEHPDGTAVARLSHGVARAHGLTRLTEAPQVASSAEPKSAASDGYANLSAGCYEVEYWQREEKLMRRSALEPDAPPAPRPSAAVGQVRSQPPSNDESDDESQSDEADAPGYAPLEEALRIYRGSGEHPNGTAATQVASDVLPKSQDVSPRSEVASDDGGGRVPVEVIPHRTQTVAKACTSGVADAACRPSV